MVNKKDLEIIRKSINKTLNGRFRKPWIISEIENTAYGESLDFQIKSKKHYRIENIQIGLDIDSKETIYCTINRKDDSIITDLIIRTIKALVQEKGYKIKIENWTHS